jgi:hypothetical protein
MVTGPEGLTIHAATSPLGSAVVAQPGFQEDLLWAYTDAVSIPSRVAIADSGDEVWVGHSLNDERVSRFSVAGGNVPSFMHSLLADNPSVVGVDASSDASHCVSISKPSSGQIMARGFSTAGGNIPNWTYTFAPEYTATSEHSVVVSADGSRVALSAYNGSDILLVLIDGAGNVITSTAVAGFSLRLDMDDSGDRVLVTAGAVARLYNTTGPLIEEYSLAVSGAGGHARISADGTAIAGGGFNVRAAREIEGVWQTVYTGTGSQDWFGGVSLSGDGETLFALSHNYGDGYLTNKHRVVDLTTGAVVASSSYTGTGGNQNSAVASESNSDGTLFVAASWGDVGNTMPEVRVYDRDLNLVDSVDTVGSPFAINLSSDAKTLAVATKAIHANNNGSGGVTYIHQLAADCLADVNGDGAVTPTDFTAWINAFNNNLPECDQNGDGSCTPTDFTAWIANFNAGC